ncbi:MAG: caspase family protein [Anaerolineales bacterium]|nr:caspase family protein [Anaerolineales bacterium]
MSENQTPIFIVLSRDQGPSLNAGELNAFTRELGELLKKKPGNEEYVRYIDKSALPQNAKVADLLLYAGQIGLAVAPTVMEIATPWVLNQIDMLLKRLSQKGTSVGAKIIVGNHEEIITPATKEVEMDAVSERISLFSRSPGNRYALVIGTSNYLDENFRSLNSPSVDAQRFASVLQNADIGAFTHVELMLDKNKHEIEQAIEQFYDNKQRDDLLLLYYSGHGIKSSDGKLLLTASNTTYKALRATSVQDRFVKESMNNSASERQILILDCCFGGAIVEGAKSDNIVGQSVDALAYFQSMGHGRAIIAASDRMQYAIDGTNIQGKIENSLFTRHLIEGLEKGDADRDNDGRIDIRELYDYIYKNIRHKQTPVLDAQLEGEIVVGINPKRKIKPAELPEDIKNAIRSKDVVSRIGAVSVLEQYLIENHGIRTVEEAVRVSLQKLMKDDSKRVSSVAASVYNKHFSSLESGRTIGESNQTPLAKDQIKYQERTAPADSSNPSTPSPPKKRMGVMGVFGLLGAIVIVLVVLFCLCNFMLTLSTY